MIIFYRILSESPNIRKISLMLEETELPYTTEYVELQSNGELEPEFFKINPNGTVPAIVDTDNDVKIFESAAILYYLAEKAEKFLPIKRAQRAETIQWLIFEAANMCPAMIELHHYTVTDTGEIHNSVFKRYKNKITQYCAILDAQLEGRDYLCGDYSIADIALYPWIITLEDIADVDLNRYPNMKQWADQISNRRN